MDYSFQKLDEERHLIGGIAYRCSIESDRQGDYVSDPADLWSGVLSFAKHGSRINLEHGNDIDCIVVESFLTEAPTRKGGRTVPANAWWITVHVPDNELWELAKTKLKGFSIEGKAQVE